MEKVKNEQNLDIFGNLSLFGNELKHYYLKINKIRIGSIVDVLGLESQIYEDTPTRRYIIVCILCRTGPNFLYLEWFPVICLEYAR